MRIARLALFASLVVALAAPGVARTEPTQVEAVPLSAPAPAWYTPELHAKVMAAGAKGYALPDSVEIPVSSLAFLGIRPGQFIIVGGGTLCSSNFVFRNGANYAIGTAGHCGNPGASVVMLALPRVLLNIGNITKSVNGGPGNDFALISIKPELNGLVSPSMAHWGGPTGKYVGPNAPLFVKHSGHGLVVGTGGTPRLGVGLTWGPTLWTFAGAILFGDSGSAATSGNGKAVGNITHILTPFSAGTSITRILQIAGLPLATCGQAPWPLYGCPHL